MRMDQKDLGQPTLQDFRLGKSLNHTQFTSYFVKARHQKTTSHSRYSPCTRFALTSDAVPRASRISTSSRSSQTLACLCI